MSIWYADRRLGAVLVLQVVVAPDHLVVVLQAPGPEVALQLAGLGVHQRLAQALGIAGMALAAGPLKVYMEAILRGGLASAWLEPINNRTTIIPTRADSQSRRQGADSRKLAVDSIFYFFQRYKLDRSKKALRCDPI